MCSQDHKQEGMVDTKHKTCAHPGCSLFPCMTGPGSAPDRDKTRGTKRKAVYCVSHAPEGSTNVTARRCRHPGCNVQPSFGLEGSGGGSLFCAKHRKRGMTDIKNRRCHVPGCVSQPRCCMPGDPRPTLCLRHAEPGMVNVRYDTVLCVFHGRWHRRLWVPGEAFCRPGSGRRAVVGMV